MMKRRTTDAIDWVDALGLMTRRSLAIIGTGKNAGKTTVLNHLLAACAELALPRPLALTSIGRDGEDEDIVTGGVKPRIFVQPSTLIATARDALVRCDAGLEVLALTKILTAAGEVVLARARTAGYVELAGPSIAPELTRCERLCREIEPDGLFLVDGALSRQSPAGGGLTEAAILVAGMANAGSMDALAERTAEMMALLTLPAVADPLRTRLTASLEAMADARVVAVNADGEIRAVHALPSLVGHGDHIASLVEAGDRALLLAGAVTDTLIDRLLTNRALADMTLIAEDGTRFFVTTKRLRRLRRRRVTLNVLHPLEVPLVAVNPMRRDGSVADGDRLADAVGSVIDRPVVNLGPALV
ncbi:MAG: hypothetical protein ACOYH4_00290 [Saccharofermentanales bacterium]|jgi:hypothetical protein